MKFRNRNQLARYLFDRVVTPDMDQQDRFRAALLVGYAVKIGMGPLPNPSN